MIGIYPFLRCVNTLVSEVGQKLGPLDFFRYFRVYGGCAFPCYYHILHVSTIHVHVVSAVVVIGVAVVILNGTIKPIHRMICTCSYQ